LGKIPASASVCKKEELYAEVNVGDQRPSEGFAVFCRRNWKKHNLRRRRSRFALARRGKQKLSREPNHVGSADWYGQPAHCLKDGESSTNRANQTSDATKTTILDAIEWASFPRYIPAKLFWISILRVDFALFWHPP
jgi:hypothetical protein